MIKVRCTVCLEAGRPGERFFVECCGDALIVVDGKIYAPEREDITAVFCAYCRENGIPGRDGVPGLMFYGPDPEIVQSTD